MSHNYNIQSKRVNVRAGATLTEIPLEMLGIHTPKGRLVHLYDVDGSRKATLCGRQIGINPRYLGLGASAPVSADLVDCARCSRIARGN